jgi:hypothetical protein
MPVIVSLIFSLFLLSPSQAQNPDTESIDAVIEALYDVISGPAGQARDWERFRALFAHDARMIPTGRRLDGSAVMRVQDVEGYIATSGRMMEERGFFERELTRRVQQFGDIAHVWTTFAIYPEADSDEPDVRGINTLQLHRSEAGWQILSIAWHAESPGISIPDKYLP